MSDSLGFLIIANIWLAASFALASPNNWLCLGAGIFYLLASALLIEKEVRGQMRKGAG